MEKRICYICKKPLSKHEEDVHDKCIEIKPENKLHKTIENLACKIAKDKMSENIEHGIHENELTVVFDEGGN